VWYADRHQFSEESVFPSSGWKMEATGSCETLVLIYHIIRLHILEDYNLNYTKLKKKNWGTLVPRINVEDVDFI
jgi:hypothetical protein